MALWNRAPTSSSPSSSTAPAARKSPPGAPAQPQTQLKVVPPEHYLDWHDALGAPMGFIPIAQLLQLEPKLPLPLPPEAVEEDLKLAQQLAEHARVNNMGPNSFPAQSLKILNMVADPNAEMNALSRAVSQDAALCAAVLKVANSTFYRGVSEIETVRDAVSRLGLAEVARIAGIVSARTLFNAKVKAEFSSFTTRWNNLYHQSITTAMGASWLALQRSKARADHCFLAGMLHDVGKSIAMRSLVALLTEKVLPKNLDPARVDRVIEASHVEIGAAAHHAWNLPSHATFVCVRHHEEGLTAGEDLEDLHVVRLVSALHLLRSEPGKHAHAAIEVFESASALGMDARAVRMVDTELKRLATTVTSLYGGTF